MNTRDGVLFVRLQFTELRSHYISDSEILVHLNDSAQKMTSMAQCNVGFYTFEAKQIGGDSADADTWQQEYPLPLDVDQVTGVSYVSGTIFPLIIGKRENIQIGSYVGGIPIQCYLKKNCRTLQQQVSDGIITMPMPQNLGPDPRTVIGFFPIPQSAIPIYVWYDSYHPLMQNPFDPVNIPSRFKEAWCAYAVARLKEKEGNLDAAQYWMGLHNAGVQEFIEWQATNGNQVTPPQYGNDRGGVGGMRNPSSSVIVVDQFPGYTNYP